MTKKNTVYLPPATPKKFLDPSNGGFYPHKNAIIPIIPSDKSVKLYIHIQQSYFNKK